MYFSFKWIKGLANRRLYYLNDFYNEFVPGFVIPPSVTAPLSSVQLKMVSMRSEKSICALPRLSQVSPALPLKQFQCSSELKQDVV